MVRQTDSGFGVDARAGLGDPLSPEALLIRSLPHDLVMGEISCAGSWQGIDLDYCDIEWFTLETNRDHSVIFEIASKYCISNSC